MNFADKKILVCGLGRSGIASAILLNKLGAFVTVSDFRVEGELELSNLPRNIKIYTGKNPDDIVLGNDLIILSPGIPTDLPFIKLAQANNIMIWSEIELAYRISPCPFIAITGTNGKTTTTTLVGEIIKNYREKSIVAGNIGIALTEKILEPDKKSYVVVEISSFQLETIDAFRPKVSVILNITPDHLDRHKTFENYCMAKAKIFRNQNKNDYAVFNFDDENCRRLSKKTAANIIFFSTKNKLNTGVYLDNGKIKINFGSINESFMDTDKINLLGEHNISNVLPAIATCVSLDVPLNIIYNTIVNFKAVPHRLEFVRKINSVSFYNDSKATNVDSAIKALDAISSPIILIGGGYDKNVDFYKWIEKFNNVRHLILIGQVKNKIAAQCDELGFENYSLFEKFDRAVIYSFKIANPGDCVLLSPACASWGMFENFQVRGDLFKQIVNLL